MSLSVDALLVAVAAALGLIPLLLTARMKHRLGKSECTPIQSYCPPAAMILPCKGLDPGFAENVASLLHQDYPDLELLFVVAADDDPAYPALKELLDAERVRNRHLNAALLVAGFSNRRAQKLTNQLAAVDQVSANARVLVFVDSDCRPDPGFVRRLVAPLGDPTIGATTGYRWYHPPRPTPGSMLRSTWNAGALPFLIDDKRVFAWGGAMAVRRETFEAAKIADAWSNAVSDDMTLTVEVRRLGLQLRFVPSCIAVSYEASTLTETLEFTNRQSLISRVYFPPLWWGTAVGHAAANVLLLYGLLSLGLAAVTGSPDHLAGSACLVLLPLQLANAAWFFGSAVELLPSALRESVRQLRWHYVIAAPFASAMTLVNTVHAATTNRLTWRGVEYELRSPSETIVHPLER